MKFSTVIGQFSYCLRLTVFVCVTALRYHYMKSSSVECRASSMNLSFINFDYMACF